jgi:hypothetical protein
VAETGILDVLVALLAFFVGSVSLYHAVGIWRVRNGSILTLALCVKLFAFFAWGAIILILTLHEWGAHSLTTVFARNGTLVDRLILSIPQGFIVLWVIPRARK